MKPLHCALAIGLAASAAACTHATTRDARVSVTTLTSGALSRSLDDAGIADILRAAFAAAAAESRGVAGAAPDPQLRHYARVLISGSRPVFRNEEAVPGASSLATEENATSREIAVESKMAEEDLSARHGIDLERAYLAREELFQKGLLALIDQELLPAAGKQETRDEILRFRATVERWLEEESMLARWLLLGFKTSTTGYRRRA